MKIAYTQFFKHSFAVFLHHIVISYEGGWQFYTPNQVYNHNFDPSGSNKIVILQQGVY